MNFSNLLKRPLYRTPRLLSAIMRLKPHWNRETYVFLNTIRRGDFVVDVGANLGHYAEVFARLVGPSGRVDAFEPVPSTCALLEQRLRRWPYAKIHNFAVSDQLGEVVLTLPAADSGQASLRPHHAGTWAANPSVTQHHAKAITLDHWADSAGWPRVDFLKLDIEGAELLALRGATTLVRRQQPLLFIEVWQEWLKDFGLTPQDLARWLREHGYDRFLMVGDTLTPLPDLENAWATHLLRGSHNILAGQSACHAGRWPGW